MSRVQLALRVSDMDASVAFYERFFGVPPHKRRDGYANFVVDEPPLKLVLVEVDEQTRGTGVAGALDHLGVEVVGADEVETARQRLADIIALDEQDTVCCHARQDKVWVQDPAGTPWEVYTILDDQPSQQPADENACCP